MREFRTYRYYRRGLWRLSHRSDDAPWVSTYKGELKVRIPVRQGKTYPTNGERERARRRRQAGEGA